jgi:hypothetical protein
MKIILFTQKKVQKNYSLIWTIDVSNLKISVYEHSQVLLLFANLVTTVEKKERLKCLRLFSPLRLNLKIIRVRFKFDKLICKLDENSISEPIIQKNNEPSVWKRLMEQ